MHKLMWHSDCSYAYHMESIKAEYDETNMRIKKTVEINNVNN